MKRELERAAKKESSPDGRRGCIVKSVEAPTNRSVSKRKRQRKTRTYTSGATHIFSTPRRESNYGSDSDCSSLDSLSRPGTGHSIDEVAAAMSKVTPISLSLIHI